MQGGAATGGQAPGAEEALGAGAGVRGVGGGAPGAGAGVRGVGGGAPGAGGKAVAAGEEVPGAPQAGGGHGEEAPGAPQAVGGRGDCEGALELDGGQPLLSREVRRQPVRQPFAGQTHCRVRSGGAPDHLGIVGAPFA